MNKAQLIEQLSDRFGGRRQAAEALDSVLDTIQRTVTAGEKVVITGFGVFERVDRPARTARNPATGERVKVKKTSVPKFRPGSDFKSFVSGAKKLPKVAAGAAKKASTAVTDAATSGTTATKRSTGTTAAKKATGKRSAAAGTSAARSTGVKKTAAKTGTSKATATKSTATKNTTAKSAAAKTTKRAAKKA